METSMQIKLSNGRIKSAKVHENGICELVIEVKDDEKSKKLEEVSEQVDNNVESLEEILSLVEASKLSLADKFMQYEPKTEAEIKFKESLSKVIRHGIKDFYRPKYDPSFIDGSEEICYITGKAPAVGRSYNWWDDVAKKFDVERGSRLGTKSEYIAFLGVLIKNMVNDGWPLEVAWNSVCNDSHMLGHYWNSKEAKRFFELTGSRDVFDFCDLGNTCKILAEDEERGGFWLAGGNYINDGTRNPLADFNYSTNPIYNYGFSVGWMVFEKSSIDKCKFKFKELD